MNYKEGKQYLLDNKEAILENLADIQKKVDWRKQQHANIFLVIINEKWYLWEEPLPVKLCFLNGYYNHTVIKEKTEVVELEEKVDGLIASLLYRAFRI